MSDGLRTGRGKASSVSSKGMSPIKEAIAAQKHAHMEEVRINLKKRVDFPGGMTSHVSVTDIRKPA